MRRTSSLVGCGLVFASLISACGASSEQGSLDALGGHTQAVSARLNARIATPVLHQYDDAPRTPDADDPAIWIGKVRGQGLVITALKDAGLAVFDLRGTLVQTLLPPNRPPLGADDPVTVGAQPESGTEACPESESGETFGRFNNVDVQYGFALRDARGRTRTVDLAVVTDRGCDRLRVFAIDPTRADGPLVDITAPDAGRIFPKRFVHPWSVGSTAASRLEDNPLDDQSTAYGLTLYRRGARDLTVFVTQRSRSNVAQLELFDVGRGQVSYRRVRELRFSPNFSLRGSSGEHFAWTPCREDAADDPQFEGLVVDQENGILYAAQEVVGIWKLPIQRLRGAVVEVEPGRLIEPVKSFGKPYWAVPDDDEFACEGEQPEQVPEGTLVQGGVDDLAGDHLEADAEGLAIYYGRHGSEGYLIASSQGDDTFHVFARTGGFSRRRGNLHLAEFTVEGAGETDGHEVVNVPAGRDFPRGLFVLQNGKAEEPENTDDVNGYEYDGSTQFLFLGWDDIAEPLDLIVSPRGYDPRR